ncbi:unnamed protein product [Boreogadus saida]
MNLLGSGNRSLLRSFLSREVFELHLERHHTFGLALPSLECSNRISRSEVLLSVFLSALTVSSDDSLHLPDPARAQSPGRLRSPEPARAATLMGGGGPGAAQLRERCAGGARHSSVGTPSDTWGAELHPTRHKAATFLLGAQCDRQAAPIGDAGAATRQGIGGGVDSTN